MFRLVEQPTAASERIASELISDRIHRRIGKLIALVRVFAKEHFLPSHLIFLQSADTNTQQPNRIVAFGDSRSIKLVRCFENLLRRTRRIRERNRTGDGTKITKSQLQLHRSTKPMCPPQPTPNLIGKLEQPSRNDFVIRDVFSQRRLMGYRLRYSVGFNAAIV